MGSKEAPIRPSRQSSESEYDDDERETFFRHKKEARSSAASRWLIIVLGMALLVSNGAWLWHEKRSSQLRPELQTLPAAKRPILRPQHWNTPFSGENKTEANALWQGLFPDGAGLIHIPRSYAAELQLPQSAPYKGNTSERVYFVAAYHNIHCLSVIRAALYHFQEGVPQTVPIQHTLHCLDSLRQDTMCHAEKTLLYTENGKIYGDGQVRECRDWDALNTWVKRHHIDL